MAAAVAAGVPRLSRRTAFIHAGVAAMAAPGEESSALFAALLADPEAEAGTFHRARIELAYGRGLRRRRSPREARRVLLAARTTFEQLGALPWAQRAEAESAATGGVRKRESRDLTPQERAVAELAAAGLTNRQIGERLFLSHRTVGTHLARVFTKLEVPARAGLRTALMRIS
ncbi:helix-turn-helix transcriptional regulator [Actinoplanes solisilvae]|uniref:helix-turn-helix transcriptional regulator n=1 Tax=Actinoplanes solisilvae TaxID=2486853 RepID=UPI000FD6DDB2|nr:helix-turn-helix transcriptional regulator [Actinoplanes solisilvae]